MDQVKNLVLAMAERNPLNEHERDIAAAEPAWADFVQACRIGNRPLRDPAGPSFRGRTLLVVHEMLEVHRQHFNDGEGQRLWSALVLCVEESVPLPYWLRREVLRINDTITREPASLHDLFGLSDVLPAKGKRGQKARQELRRRADLYVTACSIKRDDPSISDTAAAEAAGRTLGICRTTAIALYRKQERLQSDQAAIVKQKRHRL